MREDLSSLLEGMPTSKERVSKKEERRITFVCERAIYCPAHCRVDLKGRQKREAVTFVTGKEFY